jgi:hypothetical protein
MLISKTVYNLNLVSTKSQSLCHLRISIIKGDADLTFINKLLLVSK